MSTEFKAGSMWELEYIPGLQKPGKVDGLLLTPELEAVMIRNHDKVIAINTSGAFTQVTAIEAILDELLARGSGSILKKVWPNTQAELPTITTLTLVGSISLVYSEGSDSSYLEIINKPELSIQISSC